MNNITYEEINPEIFSNNKWLILKEIAEAPQSPSDLALKTNTSLSNITQQLKLLEAYRLVRKEKSEEKSSGKPRTIYYINTELVYSVILRNGKAERKLFMIDNANSLFFNIIFSMNQEDLTFMLKFSFKYEDILKKCKAIGFLKSTKDSIELFLITDHLDEIRSKFSNIFVDDHHGKTKKIINWSHNEFEVNDGLTRKDKYYMDMIKNVQIIHDPNSILRNIKTHRENM
jgi:DNA-binding HxlR family transcriptional regulator